MPVEILSKRKIEGRILKVKQQKEIEILEEIETNGDKNNLFITNYFIANYLKQQGFVNTFESFSNEAQLLSNIELHDNINLNTIFQECINNYTKKFKKVPCLIKSMPISTQDCIDPIQLESQSKALGPNSQLHPSRDFASFNNDWKDILNIISEEIKVSDVKVEAEWKDIKGLDAGKWVLNESVMNPIKFPELYKNLPVPYKGILLYGPCGVGKASLIKALAIQIENATFINIPLPLHSCYKKRKIYGKNLDRTKCLIALFQYAKLNAPSIICLDEIDKLVVELKQELLTQIDDIYATNKHVFILATSDSPWSISLDILQRFEKRISLDFPDYNDRMEMFKYYLNKMCNTTNLTYSNYWEFANSYNDCLTGSRIYYQCWNGLPQPRANNCRVISQQSNKLINEYTTKVCDWEKSMLF